MSTGQPSTRRARAASVALAIVLLTAAWSWVHPAEAASCPSTGQCLVVKVIYPGGRQLPDQTFTKLDFEGPNGASDLGYRSSPTNANYEFPKGTSLYAVLSKLIGSVASGVTAVEITDGSGPPEELSDAEGDIDPTASTYPALYPPAFFYAGGDFLNYARVQRSSEDRLPVGAGQNGTTSSSLTMTVHATEPGFVPQVSADRASAPQNTDVSFKVAYGDNRRPSGQATYAWSFEEGTTFGDCGTPSDETRAEPTHRWAGAGTYQVQVAVCGANQRYPVISAPVAIRVGPAPTPTTGPQGGGGDEANGPATGPKKGNGSTANGSNTNGTGSSKVAQSAATAAARAAARAAAEARRALGEPVDGTATVSGLLLAADRLEPFTASTNSPPPTAAASRRPGEIPKDWRWLLGLLPVVLLASGIARQSRWLAPRLPQPPWRTS